MRVLYSFPNRIGTDRICYLAWEQVRGLANAGVDVLLMPGAISRPLPDSVSVQPTLSRGMYRIPYRLLGKRAFQLHDRIVARRLKSLVWQIDLIHCWPMGALETLKEARRLGIPTVLERPNAHTRLCYEVVEAECKKLGVAPHYDYQRTDYVLHREEAEFEAADYLLCASEFSAQSFIERGFPKSKILRHRYGYDENKFFPELTKRDPLKKFIALFVGVDAVRKGLHEALAAWCYSPAIQNGIFFIAGELSTDFKRRFANFLSDPSVVQLGHRRDVPYLMRQADVMILPSIEEGFALVCVEAIGSGCVPLVSKACTETCVHGDNALVHGIGDWQRLREHINSLYANPELLAKLRDGCLRTRFDLTWTAAADSLKTVYCEALRQKSQLQELVSS